MTLKRLGKAIGTIVKVANVKVAKPTDDGFKHLTRHHLVGSIIHGILAIPRLGGFA
jgi:hypothetical protein